MSLESAGAWNRLGVACKGAGHYQEAAAAYDAALTVAEALVDKAPELLASLLHNIAGLAHAQGRWLDAEAVARRGILLRRGALQLAADPAGLAADLAALAAILEARERWDEAESLYRDALAAWSTLGDRYEEAMTANGLAMVLRHTGRSEEAESRLRRSLRELTELRGPRHPDTAVVANNLAMLLAATGRCDAAVDLLTPATSHLRASLGPRHPFVTQVAANLARLRSSY
jgi:Flp pilus assembly protein TadD